MVLRNAFFAVLSAVVACHQPSDDGARDSEHASFGSGKADGACADPEGPVADGMLAFVNDEATSFEELDALLDRRAAQGIVDARPFATLADLDAVRFVGPASCRALARHACDEQRLCIAAFRAMTWNVEHFPMTDDAEDAVVDVVRDFDVDILGVQEVEDPAAFARVDARLTGYTSVLGKPGFLTGVGALVRTATAEIVHVEHLFEDDSFAFPRPALAVTVRAAGAVDATIFTYVVVHLKALTDSRSVERRRAAVAKLHSWIEDHRERGLDHIAIVGDWNDKLTDPAEFNVYAPLLEEQAEVEFLTEPAARSGDFTLVPFQSMIDHIMVTDELLEVLPHESTEVLHLEQTSARFTEDVSDHLPVLTTLDLPLRYPS